MECTLHTYNKQRSNYRQERRFFCRESRKKPFTSFASQLYVKETKCSRSWSSSDRLRIYAPYSLPEKPPGYGACHCCIHTQTEIWQLRCEGQRSASNCHLSLEVRPGRARVLVTELSGSGQINPIPAKKPYEDSETAMELYLSPEKLKLLCGTQDLSHITSLELCIDTQENTLGNFGAYLPKLVQLKMNNSMIMSARDLGTTLSHLQVLWMTRCCLKDLDGISALSSLKELYVAYNNLSDLSHICMLENLQVLDLEGNDVDDLVQVQYLGLCSKLQKLTLEGNPVCARPNPTATQTADYCYRALVRELVPQLRYLDDVRVEEDRVSSSSIMGEDWAILQNAIRDCNFSLDATEGSGRQQTVHILKADPAQPDALLPAFPVSGPSPQQALDLTLAPDPCQQPVLEFCPLLDGDLTAPSRSTFTPRDLPIHIPEHTYDLEEPDVRERGDVFAELRAWREQHSRRLQAILVERLPQVLPIQHSNEEEEEDDIEESFSAMRDDGSEEENEIKCGDSLHTVSLDSSCQSLSPETTVSPSPPPGATAGYGNSKPQGIRERRLRFNQASPEHLKDASSVGCFLGTRKTAGDADPVVQSVQQCEDEFIQHTIYQQASNLQTPGQTSDYSTSHSQGSFTETPHTPVLQRELTIRLTPE
ncbi:Leucine-rich repeat-containing protein 56 [Channa argus]|uniref:Leucine-rich repeat-containing protein 56 n=1 Tax=Channa argus TaxID=215402 RepID=A0A6G1PFU3_CHAAH|nr:Leucine-rich repeat-containing protein 56 [Channa argus]